MVYLVQKIMKNYNKKRKEIYSYWVTNLNVGLFIHKNLNKNLSNLKAPKFAKI